MERIDVIARPRLAAPSSLPARSAIVALAALGAAAVLGCASSAEQGLAADAVENAAPIRLYEINHCRGWSTEPLADFDGGACLTADDDPLAIASVALPPHASTVIHLVEPRPFEVTFLGLGAGGAILSVFSQEDPASDDRVSQRYAKTSRDQAADLWEQGLGSETASVVVTRHYRNAPGLTNVPERDDVSPVTYDIVIANDGLGFMEGELEVRILPLGACSMASGSSAYVPIVEYLVRCGGIADDGAQFRTGNGYRAESVISGRPDLCISEGIDQDGQSHLLFGTKYAAAAVSSHGATYEINGQEMGSLPLGIFESDASRRILAWKTTATNVAVRGMACEERDAWNRCSEDDLVGTGDGRDLLLQETHDGTVPCLGIPGAVCTDGTVHRGYDLFFDASAGTVEYRDLDYRNPPGLASWRTEINTWAIFDQCNGAMIGSPDAY